MYPKILGMIILIIQIKTEERASIELLIPQSLNTTRATAARMAPSKILTMGMMVVIKK